ncbi:hypothetical protein BGZ99_000901 [Dissophora globulifera]|uniref:Ubiquitin-like protease family profile domain-containing protein n=1 Tax=Dissophora globulifera TaxID=979702 RepID=A0A9P6RPF0_9FUNG|nr:hypothetical protein BGZ99_000901 [Dissophora globulifera]
MLSSSRSGAPKRQGVPISIPGSRHHTYFQHSSHSARTQTGARDSHHHHHQHRHRHHHSNIDSSNNNNNSSNNINISGGNKNGNSNNIGFHNNSNNSVAVNPKRKADLAMVSRHRDYGVIGEVAGSTVAHNNNNNKTQTSTEVVLLSDGENEPDSKRRRRSALIESERRDDSGNESHQGLSASSTYQGSKPHRLATYAETPQHRLTSVPAPSTALTSLRETGISQAKTLRRLERQTTGLSKSETEDSNRDTHRSVVVTDDEDNVKERGTKHLRIGPSEDSSRNPKAATTTPLATDQSGSSSMQARRDKTLDSATSSNFTRSTGSGAADKRPFQSSRTPHISRDGSENEKEGIEVVKEIHREPVDSRAEKRTTAKFSEDAIVMEDRDPKTVRRRHLDSGTERHASTHTAPAAARESFVSKMQRSVSFMVVAAQRFNEEFSINSTSPSDANHSLSKKDPVDPPRTMKPSPRTLLLSTAMTSDTTSPTSSDANHSLSKKDPVDPPRPMKPSPRTLLLSTAMSSNTISSSTSPSGATPSLSKEDLTDSPRLGQSSPRTLLLSTLISHHTKSSPTSPLDPQGAINAKDSSSSSLSTHNSSKSAKHTKTQHKTLLDKASALGTGIFPHASLTRVELDAVNENECESMSIQFGKSQFVIVSRKLTLQIPHNDIKTLEYYAGVESVIVIHTKQSSNGMKLPTGEAAATPTLKKPKRVLLVSKDDPSIIENCCKVLVKEKVDVKALTAEVAQKMTGRIPERTSENSLASSDSCKADPDRQLFMFPFKSSARAKSIEIRAEDVSRLHNDELLNDTLIEFGLKHIFANLQVTDPELAEKTHMFNSFFYERLLSKSAKGIQYDSVKSWTNKTDLFSKKYIIVPINENFHWYLAVITNAGLLLQSDTDTQPRSANADSDPTSSSPLPQESAASSASPTISAAATLPPSPTTTNSPDQSSSPISRLEDALRRKLVTTLTRHASDEGTQDEPRSTRRGLRSSPTLSSERVDPEAKPYIIILDSLGGQHPRVFTRLREYLQKELLARKGIDRIINNKVLPGKVGKCPQQKNFSDCGLFLLHYAELFLRHPGPLLDGMVDVQNSKGNQSEYWDLKELATKRAKYITIMEGLTEQYQEYIKASAQQPTK